MKKLLLNTTKPSLTINIKKSKLDTNIKELKLQTNNPKIDINNPKVDINNPKVDINNPKIDINNPKVDINNPKIDTNTLKLDTNTQKLLLISTKPSLKTHIKKPKIVMNIQTPKIINNIQKPNLVTNIVNPSLFSEINIQKLIYEKKMNIINNDKKILFYGNCQMDAIRQTLNINTNYYSISCWNCKYTEINFKNIIKNSFIILTQPINDNYRNTPYLSTKYIIDNCNKDTIIIIIDSCYFNFYYFDLSYKSFSKEKINKPSDYHYNKLIDCFLNKSTPEYYKKNFIDNINLKTNEELDDLASKSIETLINRSENFENIYKKKNIFHIKTFDFIRDNYKNNLLFYSMNHPTKYLFQYICKEIKKILNIDFNIDYSCDPLSNFKGIIYKCIQKNVNFDINKHIPYLLGENDIINIIKIYYSSYNNYNLIGKLKKITIK